VLLFKCLRHGMSINKEFPRFAVNIFDEDGASSRSRGVSTKTVAMQVRRVVPVRNSDTHIQYNKHRKENENKGALAFAFVQLHQTKIVWVELIRLERKIDAGQPHKTKKNSYRRNHKNSS